MGRSRSGGTAFRLHSSSAQLLIQPYQLPGQFGGAVVLRRQVLEEYRDTRTAGMPQISVRARLVELVGLAQLDVKIMLVRGISICTSAAVACFFCTFLVRRVARGPVSCGAC